MNKINRRKFLKNSCAAATGAIVAVPSVAKSLVVGEAKPIISDKPVEKVDYLNGQNPANLLQGFLKKQGVEINEKSFDTAKRKLDEHISWVGHNNVFGYNVQFPKHEFITDGRYHDLDFDLAHLNARLRDNEYIDARIDISVRLLEPSDSGPRYFELYIVDPVVTNKEAAIMSRPPMHTYQVGVWPGDKVGLGSFDAHFSMGTKLWYKSGPLDDIRLTIRFTNRYYWTSQE